MTTPLRVLVMAPDTVRLKPVFDTIENEVQITFVSDLSQALHVAEETRAEVVLMFRDNGFDGPEFRQIAKMPFVRWVHVSGSGYEFLDPIDELDSIVSNGQGLRSRNLAETVMGAILALNSGLFQYAEQQRNRIWKPAPFRPLQGQTLLVVGTGNIGRWVAHYGKSFGMHVIGVNRRGIALDQFDEVSPLDELDNALLRADVVTIHLRLNQQTENLFDSRRFSQMKSGTLFVNTARGTIVDENALLEALQSKKIGAAYLDVFATEPLPTTHPLWSLDNVFLTPHAADIIENWDIKAAEFFVSNLHRWKSNQPLLNIVSQ